MAAPEKYPNLFRRSLVTAAFAAITAAAGCGDVNITIDTDTERVDGSGDVVAESRPIGEFEHIVLAGEGRVTFGAGSDGFIEIETDDNLLDHIETEVSGETLTIRTEDGVDIDPTSGVVYRLGCSEITKVRLSGAGSVDLSDCTASSRLRLELPGAGDIVASSLSVADLEISLPGVGTIDAQGTTDRLEVVLSGAGSFDGGDLEAAEAKVRSSGVGDATLWVTDELDLSVTGVGSVRYFGQPSVSQTITGVGTVESLGEKG